MRKMKIQIPEWNVTFYQPVAKKEVFKILPLNMLSKKKIKMKSTFDKI